MDGDAAKSVARGYLLDVISKGHWDRWQRYVAEDATFNGRHGTPSITADALVSPASACDAR